MSAPNDPKHALSTEAFQRQARVVKAFEDAWQRGERPAIDDYLGSPICPEARRVGAEATATANQTEGRLLLAELVQVDLERRWGQGERVFVEQYWQRYPELTTDSRIALDLIAAEYELRRGRERNINRDEYGRRFPTFRAQLKAVFGPDDENTRTPVETPVSLLERLRVPGDERAWERFAELYTPILLHWAQRLGLQPQDAADLVQDVFAVLVRKLPDFTYQRGKRFRGWLHAVLLHKWQDRFRRRALPASADRTALDRVAGPGGLEALWEAEHNEQLARRALQVMQKEFEETTWKAFWESVVEDRPAAEVAALLGISENAVYIAKCRVLRKLRRELEGLLD